jgi:hypothetical protein
MAVALAFAVLSIFCALTWSWMGGRGPAVPATLKGSGRIVEFTVLRIPFRFLVNKELYVRLAFAALGPSAILGLSISYAQLAPLGLVFLAFVLPAYLVMLILGFMFPAWGKRALFGFSAGVLATILYDVVRLGIAFAVGAPDPIGHIGELLLGAPLYNGGEYWWAGYLWRFFGNGAGMGIVYAMLPPWFHNVKGGLIYGEFVGMGMFALLFFAPVSQFHLFILNPVVIVAGIVGHWAYGATLGLIFSHFKKKTKEFPNNAPPLEKPITWAK